MLGFSFLKLIIQNSWKTFHALIEYNLMILPIVLEMTILIYVVIAMVLQLWLEPIKNHANLWAPIGEYHELAMDWHHC